MVEAFSLLVLGTSMIGTLLGFSQFFKEQIVNNLYYDSSSSSQAKILSQFILKSTFFYLNPKSSFFFQQNSRIALSFTATAMVVGPSLFMSTIVPDVFSTATDFAVSSCVFYGGVFVCLKYVFQFSHWCYPNREDTA